MSLRHQRPDFQRSAGSEWLKLWQEYLHVRNIPLPSGTHLWSKHLTQCICNTEIFPSASNVYWVLNLINLLADSPQSSCLSSGSSLAVGLDKALGFCFLIKASCYPEVMEESWAWWLPFVTASPGTLGSGRLASCEPVAGAQPASSGTCCSAAAWSWANQFKINVIMERLCSGPIVPQ